MDEDDIELLGWIQDRIGPSVTGKLVATLKKLYTNNKNNLRGFVDGCNAFGKLRGQEEFVTELFKIMSLGSRAVTNSITTKQEEGLKTTRIIRNSKIRVPLNYEDDVDDYYDYPSISVSNAGTEFSAGDMKNASDKTTDARLPRIRFKKINKKAAKKLKEYSASETNPELKLCPKGSVSYTPVEVPKLESFHVSEKIPPPEFNEDSEVLDRSSSSSNPSDEEEESGEREWYNHDDDYGNPVTDDAIGMKELNFTPANQKRMLDKKGSDNENKSYAEIQLYPLPINQRKELVPWFLKQYIESRGLSDSVLIGSFLKTAQEGFTSPFKNPEGAFAINARKGSKLVAMRRLARDQSENSKQTAEIAGTSVGNVLGIKEQKPEIKDFNETQSLNRETEISRSAIELSRRKLPAYTVKSTLVQIIRDNQITVIIGETGSGKTTQLAQYLYEAGLCGEDQLIGCTQPRRVAAMSVAKRVALEMDVQLGQDVGYSIRFEDKTSSNTRIKFMTDGILLREALLDESLEKYGCIIIDEAHERSLNTDIVLGILKKLLSRRRDLKLIVTSATMNAAKFSNFFGSAPLFTIPGRTYPQKLIYSKNAVDDYVEAAVMQAVSIHISTEIESGDILIFMTGQEDIEATSDSIKEKLAEVYSKNSSLSTFNDLDNIEIFTIYSALPGDVQNRIFEKLPHGKRKLVIATNIAETSLTIDGIRYVIDPGYAKVKMYNPKIGLDSLTVTPVARANADQRSGRASRTAPGTTYRLYTEDTIEEDMFAQAIPEIQRTNLSNTVLLLKSLGVEDIMEFPFIDSPPLQNLLSSLYDLFLIGALDISGNLTPLGLEMSKFPLQPSLCKVLLVAAQNGCSEEMLTIVSMLSVPQVFYRPKERVKESDSCRRRFFVAESDHLTLLNVYSQWKCNRYSHKWCSKHFLHYKSLQRAREIREQLQKIICKNGIKLVSAGSDWNIIRRCICSGFANQSAKRSGLSKYVHLKTGMDIQLHPTSALYGMGDLPPYVVYHELLMTKTEYICCVTSVDPFWLMEYGGLLYDIKRVRYVNDTNGIGYAATEPLDNGEEKEKDDELDYKLKVCLAQRDQMIRKLKEYHGSNIKGSHRTSASNIKRTENQAVKIGFKKRRPF